MLLTNIDMMMNVTHGVVCTYATDADTYDQVAITLGYVTMAAMLTVAIALTLQQSDAFVRFLHLPFVWSMALSGGVWIIGQLYSSKHPSPIWIQSTWEGCIALERAVPGVFGEGIFVTCIIYNFYKLHGRGILDDVTHDAQRGVMTFRSKRGLCVRHGLHSMPKYAFVLCWPLLSQVTLTAIAFMPGATDNTGCDNVVCTSGQWLGGAISAVYVTHMALVAYYIYRNKHLLDIFLSSKLLLGAVLVAGVCLVVALLCLWLLGSNAEVPQFAMTLGVIISVGSTFMVFSATAVMSVIHGGRAMPTFTPAQAVTASVNKNGPTVYTVHLHGILFQAHETRRMMKFISRTNPYLVRCWYALANLMQLEGSALETHARRFILTYLNRHIDKTPFGKAFMDSMRFQAFQTRRRGSGDSRGSDVVVMLTGDDEGATTTRSASPLSIPDVAGGQNQADVRQHAIDETWDRDMRAWSGHVKRLMVAPRLPAWLRCLGVCGDTWLARAARRCVSRPSSLWPGPFPLTSKESLLIAAGVASDQEMLATVLSTMPSDQFDYIHKRAPSSRLSSVLATDAYHSPEMDLPTAPLVAMELSLRGAADKWGSAMLTPASERKAALMDCITTMRSWMVLYIQRVYFHRYAGQFAGDIVGHAVAKTSLYANANITKHMQHVATAVATTSVTEEGGGIAGVDVGDGFLERKLGTA